jgi:hypothetical protein
LFERREEKVMKRYPVWTVVLLLIVVGAPLVAGAETIKHTGTVLAVSKDTGTIILGEVGPWRVEQGVLQVTRRIISVTPATEFVQVKRGEEGVEYPGDFIEAKLDAGDVAVGDFVTVDCRHEGKRLIALKISVPAITEP